MPTCGPSPPPPVARRGEARQGTPWVRRGEARVVSYMTASLGQSPTVPLPPPRPCPCPCPCPCPAPAPAPALPVPQPCSPRLRPSGAGLRRPACVSKPSMVVRSVRWPAWVGSGLIRVGLGSGLGSGSGLGLGLGLRGRVRVKLALAHRVEQRCEALCEHPVVATGGAGLVHEAEVLAFRRADPHRPAWLVPKGM